MLTNKINICAALSTATGSRIPCNPCLTAGRAEFPSPITTLSPNTSLNLPHLCFILSDLKCYGSATSRSRNHLWSEKENE
jgi:hypothetical protein